MDPVPGWRDAAPDMTTGARIPEELDALLEDAIVLGDESGLAALFADGAVLVCASGEARGGEAIAALLARRGYVASTRRVVRAGDTAVVVADGGMHVLHRGHDRAWRAAISLLGVEAFERWEDP
jgi:hypothetical protein